MLRINLKFVMVNLNENSFFGCLFFFSYSVIGCRYGESGIGLIKG